VEERDPAVTQKSSMPIYDHLRGDARFDALLRRMNLA
jgi:hypothetical protein